MFRSLIASGLALIALSFPLSSASAEEMTREAVEKIVKETILNDPQIIMDAFQNFQKNQQLQEKMKFQNALKDKKDQVFDGGSPSIGPKDATMVVVEFFDYNCGYCKKAFQDVQKLIDEDKKLRIVFKELPILSENSKEAAKWALAANKQGKYFEYHKALMEFTGMKDVALFEKIGKDLGLDVAKLKADSESKEVMEELQRTQDLARGLGISGTPAFVFKEDLLMPGYLGYETMKTLIKETRNKNEALKQVLQ